MGNKKKPNGYWTKNKCAKEALKYKSRKEFEINNGAASNVAHRNNWMDEICSHMISLSNKKWNKKKCLEEALKYKTRGKFCKQSNGTYSSASKKGWLEEACAHMVCGRKNKGLT